MWSQLGATCSTYPYTRLNLVNCVFPTRKKKEWGGRRKSKKGKTKERKWQRKEEIKKEKRDRNSRKMKEVLKERRQIKKRKERRIDRKKQRKKRGEGWEENCVGKEERMEVIRVYWAAP